MCVFLLWNPMKFISFAVDAFSLLAQHKVSSDFELLLVELRSSFPYAGQHLLLRHTDGMLKSSGPFPCLVGVFLQDLYTNVLLFLKEFQWKEAAPPFRVACTWSHSWMGCAIWNFSAEAKLIVSCPAPLEKRWWTASDCGMLLKSGLELG